MGVVRQTRPSDRAHDARALATMHLAHVVHVEVWVIALQKPCFLLLFRLIIWRRFGLLVGLMIGPPSGVHTYSHGRRVLNHGALARHLETLRQQGHWPRGRAPVLLTGCSSADLQQVLMHTASLPLAQRRRLTAYPHTVSERGATAGLPLQRFLKAPSSPALQRSVALRRARAALAAAHVAPRGVRALSESTAQGDAFRDMLF